jgi:hypothetical protein
MLAAIMFSNLANKKNQREALIFLIWSLLGITQ